MLSECNGGILRTLVRTTVLFSAGFIKCSHYKVYIKLGRYIPGADLARKQVYNNAQVVPFAGDFNVGENTCPNDIRWSGFVDIYNVL